MAVVCECQIANVDVATRRLGQPGAAVLHDIRLDSPHFVEPQHRRHAALEKIDHPPEGDERPDHAAEVKLKCDEGADGHRARNHLPAAHEENHAEHDANHAVQRRVKRRRQPNQRSIALNVLAIHAFEIRDLVRFLSECPHDANAGEILLHAGGNVAEVVLHRFEAQVNFLAEELHQPGDDRKRDERDERHRTVDAHHHHE